MCKVPVLAVMLTLAACSRNPEPEIEATDGATATVSDTTMSDTTMMAGDSAKMGEMGMQEDTAQATGDSALVNQEGAAAPVQETMESDTVMGDSTLTGQANDSHGMGDSSMTDSAMTDSAMVETETPVEGAVPTDSAQGQRR